MSEYGAAVTCGGRMLGSPGNIFTNVKFGLDAGTHIFPVVGTVIGAGLGLFAGTIQTGWNAMGGGVTFMDKNSPRYEVAGMCWSAPDGQFYDNPFLAGFAGIDYTKK